MGKVIPDASSGSGEFYPMVGLRKVGDFVRGKVTGMGTTANGNPFVTLSLLDLKGSTSKSVSKGVYEEVDVVVGDSVQVIGSVKRLREKLPQVAVGEVVSILFKGTTKLPKGKARNEFHVEVE